MKKRILALVLSLALTLSAFATMSVSALNPTIKTDFRYSFENGCVRIIYYEGNDEEVTVPSTIDGCKVTAIDSWSFADHDNLKKVTLPDTIKNIGTHAFYNTAFYNDNGNWDNNALYIGSYLIAGVKIHCDENTYEDIILSAVKGDYSVKAGTTVIADGAFENCKSLTAITIPNSVKEISNEAFTDCELLTTVNLPDDLESIGDEAFQGCKSLKSIELPNKLNTIWGGAFENCESLESINLPDSLTYIGRLSLFNTAYYNNNENWDNGALYKDNYLLSLCKMRYTEEGFEVLNEVSGSYRIKDGTKLIADGAGERCSRIKEIIVPNSIHSIPYALFFCCNSLESIIIPDSVTDIDDAAFFACKKLKSITMSKNITHLGREAFYDTEFYNDTSNWEDGVLYLENCLVSGKQNDVIDYQMVTPTEVKGSYQVKEGTQVIADYAFFACSELTDITLPSSLKTIGSYAFNYCTALSNVTIPNSVNRIDSFAFYQCDSLKEITVPSSVTKIGEYAFGYTEDNLGFTIPSDVIITCVKYSAADKYAVENKLNHSLLENTDINYGDINFDDAINMLDVLLIRKYIAKQPVWMNLDAADVTGDGDINMLDVLLIRKYIAKQPVSLDPNK